jgi:hypothetical protein
MLTYTQDTFFSSQIPPTFSWWIVHAHLARVGLCAYPAIMYIEPLASLNWAYQLHYLQEAGMKYPPTEKLVALMSSDLEL